MTFVECFVIFLLTAGISRGLPANGHRDTRGVPRPPLPRFVGSYEENYDREKIYNQVNSWTPDDKDNVWELSGLWEGDIMTSPNSNTRNGLINEAMRWPGGVVPYYIQEEDFDQEDITKIEAAMEEYHEKTCLRFRPYKESDVDYVVFQGSGSGCWSWVGKQGQGQVINVQKPGCLRHGTIVHEIMHAVGFYHQQSSSDRDEYVKIVWDNIQKGKDGNFQKYSKKKVTDYGAGYDYGSVMHYSSKAFSANGEATIVPLENGVKIGQREGLNKKDIAKLQTMYKKCA